jgi:WD40 repeat protein
MEKTTQEWEIIETFEQPGAVQAIDLLKNRNMLATASGDFKSRTFRFDTHKESQSFDNHNQITRAISIHHNMVATGSDDTMARVINLAKPQGVPFAEFVPNETCSFENKDIVSAVKFNRYANKLAVAANHTVRLFDLVENKRLFSIHHQDQPISICFDKNDTAIITASLNKVRVFDIRTKGKLTSFRRDNRYIASVVINDNNEILTVETPGDTIQIYNKITKKITNTHIPVTIDAGAGILDRYYNGEPLYSICLHPGGKMLALGTYCKALVIEQNDKK